MTDATSHRAANKGGVSDGRSTGCKPVASSTRGSIPRPPTVDIAQDGRVWQILMRRRGRPDHLTRTIHADTQDHAEMLALKMSEGSGSGWYVADAHMVPNA